MNAKLERFIKMLVQCPTDVEFYCCPTHFGMTLERCDACNAGDLDETSEKFVEKCWYKIFQDYEDND